MSGRTEERFSGHESFVCRYGWLPKVFRAVEEDHQILRDEMRAMHTLGIGRNMVKSIQFWGECTGVIAAKTGGGHKAGPVGLKLLGDEGWDPYLETLESLWLVHWWLSTQARLAAWCELFGIGRLQRFDRKLLVERLAQRGEDNARALASSTLEQHAGIFLQSYYQEKRGLDDTSWCPLQDLGLVSASSSEDGRILFSVASRSPIGLTERAFAMALVHYIDQRGGSQRTVSFADVLRGEFSPGIVFKLDEGSLRQHLDSAQSGLLRRGLKFHDTADTQTLVLDIERVPVELRLANLEVANV
jgi:hypothetical protein